MWRRCNAYAKTKGRKCNNRVFPGSCYCFIHLEKVPMFVGALLGALLSVLFAEAWTCVVPSKERLELESLRSDIRPVLELARSRDPQASDRAALEVLVEEVKNLRDAEARIRTFETEVAIDFYGSWAKGRPPETPGVLVLGNSPDNYLDLALADGTVRKAFLHLVGLPSITRLDDNGSVIRYRTQVRSGNWPVGEDARLLRRCEGGRVVMYSVNRDSVTDNQIGIRSLKLTIFLNGQKQFELQPKGDGRLPMPAEDGGSLLFEFECHKDFQQS